VNYQKKAAAILRKQMRDNGGMLSVALGASAARILEKMEDAGEIEYAGRDGDNTIYRLKTKNSEARVETASEDAYKAMHKSSPDLEGGHGDV
jgi:hypothetical protein